MRHIFANRCLGPILILLLWLGAGGNHVLAQSKNDSLLATFDGVQDDSVRIDSMLKIAFQLSASDPPLGLWLCNQAGNDPYTLAHPWARARAYNNRGVLYYSMQIHDLAMSNLLEAARIGDTFGIERVRVSSINNIGTIQESQGLFEEALDSYRRARAGYLKNNSAPGAVLALTNIALVYFDLKEYERALQVCDSVIVEIAHPENALAYARVYGLMGEIYLAQEEYGRAVQMLDKSIELAAKAGDDNGMAEDMITRATAKLSLNQLDGAYADLQAAMPIERRLGVLPFVVDCYELLAQVAKKQGNFAEAVRWMEKGKALADSIHTEDSKIALANYQALYEVDQKDAEINLLSKDKEIQAAKYRNVWYVFGLISVILLAMVAIVVVLMRNNKARRRVNLELERKNAQILQQNEKISQQNATLTDQNEQLNTLNREMTGLLNVVAHDLKAPMNQLGGLMTVIEGEGSLNATQEKMLMLAKKVTQNAGNLVNDLVEFGNVQQQLTPLHLGTIEAKALVAEVIATFAAEAARKSIRLETKLPNEEITVATEPDHLRRVLENLISNALKFSPSGKTVTVSLTATAKALQIAIQDQGPGISPADQQNLYRRFHRLSARPTGGESSSGLGLAIVKMLVEKLGGDIALESEVGTGSTFVVSMPRT